MSRSLPDDCTGLVRFAYGLLGIELMQPVEGHRLNGVTIIFRGARSRGALHAHAPSPGDLVFFRETYDRDRDGARDDGLTHVAVVESVGADRTVTFVHRSGQGITRGRMNLARPDVRSDELGAVINDYLRTSSRGRPAAFAAELFVGFASAEVLLGGGLVSRQ
ncbi:MAG: CHAP domain-containing protein [Myxococcaceae bacterium]